MPNPSLFDGFEINGLSLKNRIAMAPMTRCRAEPDWSPGPDTARYYAQRSSAGLVIVEATQVCPDATGYPGTPGIWTQAHVDAWAPVAEGIKAEGARAFIQFWHCGRMAHPDNMPPGCVPIGPSPIASRTPIYSGRANAKVPSVVPREMTEADIARVIKDHRQAARNAKSAGFDGVELHGANGYLIEQFSASNTNRRTDGWGGTLEKRLRFMRELMEAVSTVFDRSRVGIRLSPYGTYNEIEDENPAAFYEGQLAAAEAAGIGYVHIIRPVVSGDEDRTANLSNMDVIEAARKFFSGAVIAAGGYSVETGQAELGRGSADIIAFGRPFVANPDLPRRMREARPLAPIKYDLLYVPGPAGYIDYPTLDG